MRKGTEHWSAIALDRSHRLAYTGDTIEEMRSIIDRSNERSVDLGYKASQYIIAHCEYYNWFDENDEWIKTESIEQRVEVYPKTLIKEEN